ncbi:hypothetical protein EDEG_00765 [Edhazardia aedis USNM 41457]|uniref:Uncharacterized protein n=1 Tax=Edhazardia aedis (strain USNM 41457) TaxID=1003232 RepID=J9DCE2_EDHAE|nr:hypothetical protein EDEG_00765 [Edhazardia aedis USNM 41457]|eukprot:EJW05154.1 hypothetical protein EDEG_00765 [Edhazardia aedis USNM 41457]
MQNLILNSSGKVFFLWLIACMFIFLSVFKCFYQNKFSYLKIYIILIYTGNYSLYINLKLIFFNIFFANCELYGEPLLFILHEFIFSIMSKGSTNFYRKNIRQKTL